MKKLVVFFSVIFLIGFIAAGITTKAIENNRTNLQYGYGPSDSPNANQENKTPENQNNDSMNSHHESENKQFITEKNRLKFENRTGVQCPDNCTCNGVVVKCLLSNGTREMTIYAGESGNIIIQVKGDNMTTNVTLYKSDGKIYSVDKNNETKEIKLLPDQVKERIRTKLSRQLENETISLDENGTYQYKGEQNVTIFFFHAKENVNAKLDSTTGEIVELKKPWWAFLAKEEGQQLVGASCGTVTPGQNDACCKTKGYDFWNMTAAECEFSN